MLERVVGVFDHEPGKAEAERAMVAAGVAMRHAFENREAVAHLMVDDARRAAILKEGGWLPEGVRRHPQGGRHLHALLAYGLAPSAGRELWAVAAADGPPLEDVAERLRLVGDSMGLPPVGFGPEVPVFEAQRRPSPARRRGVGRDRGNARD